MAYRLGVDVGGTFTDLFLVEDSDHRQWRVKTPSTPSDPSQGVLKGVSRICEEAGISPADQARMTRCSSRSPRTRMPPVHGSISSRMIGRSMARCQASSGKRYR